MSGTRNVYAGEAEIGLDPRKCALPLLPGRGLKRRILYEEQVREPRIDPGDLMRRGMRSGSPARQVLEVKKVMSVEVV